MFKWFKKKSAPAISPSNQPVTPSVPTTPSTESLTWDAQATQALEMAMQQAPVPSMMKGRVRKELAEGAETAARQAGRTTVSAEDLMNGLMAKLPPNMQAKAQQMLADKMKNAPKN